MNETLADLGEKEILNRLKQILEFGQIDDDTALIKNIKNNLLINTDVLVEGVHFSDNNFSPEDIGWKAIASNYSDLTCSGMNQPLAITVGLIAPSQTSWSWVEGVYKGMLMALKTYGGKLVGGDCSRGLQKIISITALGTQTNLHLHRSYAQPEELLIASGPHGLSKLGLALLNNDSNFQNFKLSQNLCNDAIQSHKRPIPPLQAVKNLHEVRPKDSKWKVAGTDSSDGLLIAVQSICDSSKCSAIIDKQKLPKHSDWPKGNMWNEWCLFGGEDFQLITALPKKWAEALIKIMPSAVIFGRIIEGNSEVFWKETMKKVKASNNDFQHFT